MTNVLKKLILNGTLYNLPKGSELETVTETEYDNLPSSKLTDGVFYVITGIPATGITLNKDSITLTTAGDTEQLTATLTPAGCTSVVTWSSSDTTIATVSSTGLVTCVTPGTCTITATADGQSATCGVTGSGGGWTPGANTLVYYNINDNDTSSTIYDLSGNSVDQTWQGNASYTTDADYGRVAVFNGNTHTEANSIVNFGSECTFIALFYRNNISNPHAIVTECANASDFPIGIAFSVATKYEGWYAGAGASNTKNIESIATTQANQWVMIATTRASDGTAKIYINGVLDNTVTGINNPNYSSGNTLRISNWRDNYYRLEGKFKLFIGENRTRTDQEIADLAIEYGFNPN